MSKRLPLSPVVVTTLDIVRVSAALYVVLHHLTGERDESIQIFFKFGQEAVIAFFLLSGFVIHANEKHRAHGFAGYAVRRVTRIYPVLIASMLVSVGIAGYDGWLSDYFKFSEALCNLIALQDRGNLLPGTICSPFMGNTPLWSLSYEIVFYLIYPAILPLYLSRPSWTTHAIGILSAVLIIVHLILPSHFFLLPAYFLIWWTGAMMAEAYMSGKRGLLSIRVPVGYLILTSSLWSGATAIAALNETPLRFGWYPLLNLRHFSAALLFATVGFGALGASFVAGVRRLPQAKISYVVAFLSSISYGVYVFHFPLLRQWSVAQNMAGFFASISVLLLLSYVLDRRLTLLIRYYRGNKRSIKSVA